MDAATYIVTNEKEEVAMKGGYAKELANIGGGFGVILFTVFGLLAGANLGGVMGLNVTRILFGLPVSSGVPSRPIVAATIMAGVIVSAIMFITVPSIAGWLIGTAVDAVTTDEKDVTAVMHK
jgi:hypothetical protein